MSESPADATAQSARVDARTENLILDIGSMILSWLSFLRHGGIQTLDVWQAGKVAMVWYISRHKNCYAAWRLKLEMGRMTAPRRFFLVID